MLSYKKKFSNSKQDGSASKAGVVLALFLLSIFVGVTLAFFFSSDYASKNITMSGAVKIEAVGPAPARNSIEDTVTTSKLVVELDKTYNKLIPGMPISIPANCKVYKSSTKPLLRAMLDITMYENDLVTESGDLSITLDFMSQMYPKIKENGWYLHTDGYFYYVKGIDQDPDALLGDTILQEVDATLGHNVVDFINFDITVPNGMDSTYSGKGVKFTITFQAIQNYIPDDEDTGIKVSNTIDNAEKIFSTFYAEKYSATSLDYFTITSSGGELVLDIKNGVSLPEVVVLPSEDSEGNPITTLGTTFSGNCGDVKNLVVPSSYTTIAPEAFKNTTISSVDLSKTNITEIPTNCFNGSMVTSVKLPITLRTIGDRAFRGSDLRSLVVPEGVTSIGYMSLWLTNLRCLYISSTVASIDSSYFVLSPFLNKIIVHEDNEYYYDIDDSVLIGLDGNLYVASCNITNEYILPDGVTKLGSYCLNNTTITSLNINDLQNCYTDTPFPSTLLSISIPNDNEYFYTTTGIDLINKAMQRIDYICNSINSVDYSIPDNVVYSLSGAWINANIGKLFIGKNYKAFNGSLMLKDSNFDSFEVHSDNQYFYTNTGNELINTDGVLLIYSNTCANNSYEVAENVTEIARWAFKNKNLKNITISSTVTKIADANNVAFVNCFSLQWIEFKSINPPTISASILFSECPVNVIIYVPHDSVNLYKNVTALSSYVDRIKSVNERT